MKRTLAVLLLLLFLLSLCACGEKAGEEEPPAPTFVLDPLTGEATLDASREGKRPYAIFINNMHLARPGYGVSEAEIVIEGMVEGGLTRYMAVYSDLDGIGQIGPVRSLRHYFAEAVMPLDPIIQNFGTDDYFVPLLEEHGIETIDVMFDTDSVFLDEKRNETFTIENCWFTNKELLENAVSDGGLRTELRSGTPAAFDFLAEGEEPELSGGEANSLSFIFGPDNWVPYDGSFVYDADSGRYLKWQNGVKCIDADNMQPLAFDNLFILFAKVDHLENSMLIDVILEEGGEGYYCRGGRFERITWQKGSWEESFSFTREDGEPLKAGTGKSYIAIADKRSADSWECA